MAYPTTEAAMYPDVKEFFNSERDASTLIIPRANQSELLQAIASGKPFVIDSEGHQTPTFVVEGSNTYLLETDIEAMQEAGDPFYVPFNVGMSPVVLPTPTPPPFVAEPLANADKITKVFKIE